ncbi:MAG: hypothetical protein ACXABO_04010 [Promethearchaeota archaeon]|jgi:hypothetical protein
MALGDILRYSQEIIDNFEEKYYPDLTGVVMPFSEIKDEKDPQFIYKGEEKIPFAERDPEYQKTFIAEFLND